MTRKDKTSRLEKLRKHWHRASEEERLRFITELELNIDLGDADRDRAKTAAAPDCQWALPSAQAIKRIEAVMIRRSIDPCRQPQKSVFGRSACPHKSPRARQKPEARHNFGYSPYGLMKTKRLSGRP